MTTDGYKDENEKQYEYHVIEARRNLYDICIDICEYCASMGKSESCPIGKALDILEKVKFHEV